LIPELPASGEISALVGEILSPDGLKPVNTRRWARVDIRNAYTNADELLILVSSIDPAAFEPPDREPGIAAMKRIRSCAKRCRGQAQALLFMQSSSLAKALRDSYRKAIAKDYDAMIEAGSVLVRIGEPRSVNTYNSLVRNDYE
jgi:hypothetical protein